VLVGVFVAVGVGVSVGVGVDVLVGVGVFVPHGLVGVGVLVGMFVAVGVSVGVLMGVFVAVGVSVGVLAGVSVGGGVLKGVGVFVGSQAGRPEEARDHLPMAAQARPGESRLSAALAMANPATPKRVRTASNEMARFTLASLLTPPRRLGRRPLRNGWAGRRAAPPS